MMSLPSTLSSSAVSVATLLSAASLRIAQTLNLDKRIARLEARVLGAHAWNVTPTWLIAHDRDPLTPQQYSDFEFLLNKRLQGEPIAYITGWREFYGRPFRVTPDVLIPRPETELLVDLVLAQIPSDQTVEILELGTGSGCIAISLALARPHALITAVDNNAAALSVAQRNAIELGATVNFLKSDWFSSLPERKFDLIVSNPPYVARDDTHLLEGDVRFEPLSALNSGINGIDDLHYIIIHAPSFLKSRGSLLLEHGYGQGQAARILLQAAGYSSIETWQDLSKMDRVSGGNLSE